MQIRYYKKETSANCQYIAVNASDMIELIHICNIILAKYAEHSATPVGAKIVLEKNKELFGVRRDGSHNTRLSILGGFITNYYNKAKCFKNDMSMTYVAYLEIIINEYAELKGEELIHFVEIE